MQEEKVDYVCVGEGYYPILELVKQLKNSIYLGGYIDPYIQGIWSIKGPKVRKNGIEKVNDLDLLPSPSWDLLPMEKYKAHHWQTWNSGMNRDGFAVLYTSLGCPFSCEFCSVNVVYGEHKQRVRKIDNIISVKRVS